MLDTPQLYVKEPAPLSPPSPRKSGFNLEASLCILYFHQTWKRLTTHMARFYLATTILKEISPMLRLKLQYFGHLM